MVLASTWMQGEKKDKTQLLIFDENFLKQVCICFVEHYLSNAHVKPQQPNNVKTSTTTPYLVLKLNVSGHDGGGQIGVRVLQSGQHEVQLGGRREREKIS